MEYSLPQYLNACLDLFNSLSSILYYTHLPPAIISLLFAAYFFLKQRDRAGITLGIITVLFSIYALLDLLLWMYPVLNQIPFLANRSNTIVMVSWAMLGLLSSLLFLCLHWFVHISILRKPLPDWMLALWMGFLIPIFLLTPTSANLKGFHVGSCAAIENAGFSDYYYGLGMVAMILIAISWMQSRRLLRSEVDKDKRSGAFVIFLASELFLFFFLATGILATYLVDAGIIPDFGVEQYGLATMTFFIGVLAYATVRYRTFNIKLLGAQALVTTLVAVVAAELAFVTSATNRLLVLFSLGLSLIFGYFLVKSVKKEVEQRELIEKQEKELEVVNQQQENLLHFISHEVKGYLTESQAGFASIIEGDFGVVPDKVKQMSVNALASVRRGVATVMDILDASNLKKGTVAYKKTRFDLRATIRDVVNELKKAADEKGLTIELSIGEGQFLFEGDEEKLRHHVIRNLIDNAIKYTPHGTVKVNLTDGKSIKFSVHDSGVGITEEDKKKLFTEGGHGKDSIKVNVHSTGYGLYIAKQVVEAHGGRIWAESEGAGKGSTFIVEWPVPSMQG